MLKSGRPNLVIVRAGDDSLHPKWFRPEEPRSWDLLVSYYGATATEDNCPEALTAADAWYAEPAGSKFMAIQKLLVLRPEILDRYERFFLVDPDLLFRPGDIDRLFLLAERHELDICQPALSHDSYHTFRITLQHPSFVVRFTNFVETMCPLFSRHALELCLPTFDRTHSSWGVDLLWPGRLGNPTNRMGIVDAVSVCHTKPIDHQRGTFYQKLRREGVDPVQELHGVLQELNLQHYPLKTYGIVAEEEKIRR